MLSKLGFLVGTGTVLVAFGGFAVASPPVPPPQEGFGIRTFCDVEMHAGDFTEDESFAWTWIDDNVPADVAVFFGPPGESTLEYGDVDQYLDWFGRAGQIRYTEELDSIDTGLFQFNKTFDAASHDEPNLDVDKIYGWEDDQTSLITSVRNEERVGLSIVAMGDSAGLGDMPSLCPWTRNRLIPATNEFIAMSSGSSAGLGGSMLAETRTDVLATGPPSMDHNISAEGIGRAEAHMRLHLMEGDAGYDPLWDWHFVDFWPDFHDWVYLGENEGPPDLISEAEYREDTMATGGISNFDKEMHYHSTIPQWQMPDPWHQLQSAEDQL